MNDLTVMTKDFALVPSEHRDTLSKALALMAQREPSVQYPSKHQLKVFVTGQHETPWENYKQTVAEIETRVQTIATQHYLARVQEGQLAQWQWVCRWALRFSKVCGWFSGVAGVAAAKAAFLKYQITMAREDVQRKCEQVVVFQERLAELQPQIDGKDREELEAHHWATKQRLKEQQELSSVVQHMSRMMIAQQMVKQELSQKNGKEQVHGT